MPGWAASAVRDGASMIQIRERGLDARDLASLVAAVAAAVAPLGVPVTLNDRIDVALAAGAAGVHLPAGGADPARVRTMVPAEFIIGRSVHAVDEAVEVAAAGACDYLIFGTVFQTGSKPPGHPIAGLAGLRAVCERVQMPVLAIGGIDEARVPLVLAVGAAGAAAISLFARADGHPDAARWRVD